MAGRWTCATLAIGRAKINPGQVCGRADRLVTRAARPLPAWDCPGTMLARWFRS